MSGDLLPKVEMSHRPIEKAEPANAAGLYEVMRKTWLTTYPNQESGISYDDIRTRIEGKGGGRLLRTQAGKSL